MLCLGESLLLYWSQDIAFTVERLICHSVVLMGMLLLQRFSWSQHCSKAFLE